jgi:hypothetical protein
MAISNPNKIDERQIPLSNPAVSSEKGELRGREFTRGAPQRATAVNPFVPDPYRPSTSVPWASQLAALAPRALVDRCRNPETTVDEIQNIVAEITRRHQLKDELPPFTTRDLILLCHALAKRSIAAPQLFEWIANALIAGNPDAWNSQDLSMIAGSFATAKCYHKALFKTICEQVKSRGEP